jgi:Tfp pilus assembly protein PilW
MTTFLMMGRTGQLAQNYTELEVEARKALETFSRDARMAYGVSSGWGNSTVTFMIPDSSENRTSISYYARYTFDDTAKTFSRQVLNSSGVAVGNATTLVTKVEHINSNPYLRYFKYVGATTGYSSGYGTNYAASTTEVKQVELNFIARRTTTTVSSATDKVLSARFILRNK